MGINYSIPAVQDLTAITRVEAESLGRVLREFTRMVDENGETYKTRRGDFMLAGQKAYETHRVGGASILNLRYALAKTILTGTLPQGSGEVNGHVTSLLASSAIVALLDETSLYLSGGIYHPPFRNEDVATNDSSATAVAGSLLVLNTTFGRFLMGVGDTYMVRDADYQYDLILVAAAYALHRLFPTDEMLRNDYTWLKKTCRHVHQFYFDAVEDYIGQIFAQDEFLSELARQNHLPFGGASTK